MEPAAEYERIYHKPDLHITIHMIVPLMSRFTTHMTFRRAIHGLNTEMNCRARVSALGPPTK
jgi:hypothetical protein